jgi:hypothetical protein
MLFKSAIFKPIPWVRSGEIGFAVYLPCGILEYWFIAEWDLFLCGLQKPDVKTG